MKFTLKILTPIFVLSLLGCVAADEKDATSLQGTWQSEEFDQNGDIADLIYNFSGSSFDELISIKNDNGNFEVESENKGSFTILDDTIKTQSGLTAYQVNFEYNRVRNELVKQIAYIENKQLFLGNTTEVENDNCVGDTYTLTTTEVEIEDGQVINAYEVSRCFTRPTKINLNFPYNKI